MKGLTCLVRCGPRKRHLSVGLISVGEDKILYGAKTSPRRLAKDHLSDFENNFKSKARFLVDESVGMAIAGLIRDRGWNVRYVDDVGLLGQSEEEILTFAWREQRILLTHNLEFLDDCRFPFRHNPGLVVLPGATGSGSDWRTQLMAS